jgi:putative SOS response-associated peptidase YedK
MRSAAMGGVSPKKSCTSAWRAETSSAAGKAPPKRIVGLAGFAAARTGGRVEGIDNGGPNDKTIAGSADGNRRGVGGMCNEYENPFSRWEEYAAMMAGTDLGSPTQPPAFPLPAAATTRIGDSGLVLRAAGNVVEPALMKFGFPPPRPKAGPVFNFRSEGRHFGESARCLILARGFFEFTGASYPKTRHRFSLAGSSCFAIAGIWRAGPQGEAFSMLTTEPGPDVAPVHDRQIVVLPQADWGAWIYLTRPEAELLRPLPAGALNHEVVRQGA